MRFPRNRGFKGKKEKGAEKNGIAYVVKVSRMSEVTVSRTIVGTRTWKYE
jgi:hypothetical protein